MGYARRKVQKGVGTSWSLGCWRKDHHRPYNSGLGIHPEGERKGCDETRKHEEGTRSGFSRLQEKEGKLHLRPTQRLQCGNKHGSPEEGRATNQPFPPRENSVERAACSTSRRGACDPTHPRRSGRWGQSDAMWRGHQSPQQHLPQPRRKPAFPKQYKGPTTIRLL